MITVIDCNGVCHTVKHSLDEEFIRKDGIIFSFLNRLLLYSKTIPTEKFVFAWDSKESVRKQKLANYKEKEKPTEIDLIAYEQFDQLREIVLPALGFKNILYQRGYEGDDVIASFVKCNPYLTTIITSDNDLHQLLNDKVDIFSIKEKKIFNQFNFQQKHRINPSEWWKVKSITGDAAKQLEGVPEVGHKTAIAYLNGELSPTSKKYLNIISGKYDDVIKRNESFLKLPIEGTKEFHLQDETLYHRDFLYVFKELDFRYFLSSERDYAWVTNFHLT